MKLWLLKLLVRIRNWQHKDDPGELLDCQICGHATFTPPMICVSCQDALEHLDQAQFSKYLRSVEKR